MPEQTRSYEVTDAQVHIWADDRPDRPWPADGKHRAHCYPAFTLADLLSRMDAAGVARAVLVPPSFEGDRNDVVVGAAQRHPDRFVVMARFDPAVPDADGALRALLAQPGVVGLRMTYHRPQMRELLTAPTTDWLWAELAAQGTPVMVYAPGRNETLGAIAKRHPRLPLIVDTLGLTLDMRDSAIDEPICDLLRLAEHPNVAVKATALPAHVTDDYPFPSLAGRLRNVVDTFGKERVFWASDLTRVGRPYRQSVDYLADLAEFSPEELTWLMGRGISTWLRWPQPTSIR